MIADMDIVFVNPKTAFHPSFLDYHGALQFSASLSMHATAFAQKEILWKGNNEHARWRIDTPQHNSV